MKEVKEVQDKKILPMEKIIIINVLQPYGDTVSVEIENILTVRFILHYQS